MTDQSEKYLVKVRGLLAKAADPNIDPREADLFRSKADELMVKYAIEQWQVEKPAGNDREIISRHYDFSWYVDGGHGGTLWSIMLSIARHCRVKVVHWEANFTNREIPIVGLKSDLDWFDLLFTNVMTDFVAGLEPRPNAALSFEENVARLKESGMQWLRIAELLWHADMLDRGKYPDLPNQKQVHNMGLATVYTKFCDRTGRARLRVTPQIYRRSYSAGYDNRLHDRLREMRLRTSGSHEKGSGMEIVLADIYDRVLFVTKDLFGEPPKYRGGRAVSRDLKFSSAAMADGARRADNVDISASKHRVTTPKRQIEG